MAVTVEVLGPLTLSVVVSRRASAWLWATLALAGVALMLAYTAILTAAAPELWADPFGPLVKNIAVLGLSLAVHAKEIRHG